MKRIVVIACWMGLASYCALSSIAGPSGILETARAARSAEAMRLNVETLRRMNEAYAAEWDGLRGAPEAIALEGRSLGYLADNEVVVRLAAAPEGVPPPSPGQRLGYEASSICSEARIKELSAILAIVTLVIGLGLRFYSLFSNAGTKRQRDILAQEASRT